MAVTAKNRPIHANGVQTIHIARVTAVLLGLLYPLLLLWSLRDLVAPVFWYMGYIWSPPTSSLFGAFSIVLAVAPLVLLPTKGRRPGAVMLWILYLIAYVPIQIVPAFSSANGFANLYPMQLSVLTGFAIVIAMSRLPVVRVPSIRIGTRVFFAGIILFSLGILALALLTYGVPRTLPSLTDVYDVRTDFRDQNRGVGFFALLLINWEQKVINPLLIAIGLVQRRWMILAFGVVGQLMLFGINGQKSVFFSGLLVLAVVIAMWGRGRFLSIMMTSGAVALVIGTATLDLLTGTVSLTSLFVRRLILTPGLLTGYYFDFFSDSSHVRLANSVLSPLFEYPYSESIPRLIGVTYFGRPELAANANIWADAFAHFGVLGVIAFSFILGCVILLFNSLALDRNVLVTSALAGMAAWTLTDTALFVALNTHGILFSLILLILLPREGAFQEESVPVSQRRGSRRGRLSKRREESAIGMENASVA